MIRSYSQILGKHLLTTINSLPLLDLFLTIKVMYLLVEYELQRAAVSYYGAQSRIYRAAVHS